jgi:hypothetical protein
LHEEILQSPLSTLSFINRFIDDLEVLKSPAAPKKGCTVPAPRWIAPPDGVTKINVDATLSRNTRLARVAAIARDETCLFMGASALIIRGANDLETLEVGREWL